MPPVRCLCGHWHLVMRGPCTGAVETTAGGWAACGCRAHHDLVGPDPDPPDLCEARREELLAAIVGVRPVLRRGPRL